MQFETFARTSVYNELKGELDKDELLRGDYNGQYQQPSIDSNIRWKLNKHMIKLKSMLFMDRKQLSGSKENQISIDSPLHFDFEEFVLSYLREEIEVQSRKDSKIRGWMGTLLLRLEQIKQDSRYNFLFQIDSFENALASFLRWIFGVAPAKNFIDGEGCPPWKDFYDDQYPNESKQRDQQHNITILDFSQLASDVLENVTALIGRLILEFMQRCPDRGQYPVVLVLEEAHHYIPANPINERQQRAREVFERIAKEGRKYGLSLVVASQRPSELSKTVMAQCNSFIVHRIQNPDDKMYFRSVVSDINKELLDQLPALPQQHALVLGECITVPLQVRINDVDPRPDSKDPKFYEKWKDKNTKPPDFEEICLKWEGQANECTSTDPSLNTNESEEDKKMDKDNLELEKSSDGAKSESDEDLPF